MAINLGPGLQQLSQNLSGMAQMTEAIEQRRLQLNQSAKQNAYRSGSTLADTKIQMEAYEWLKQADAKLLSGEIKAEDAGSLLEEHLRSVYEANRQSWFGDDDLSGMFESEALEPFIVKMYQQVDSKALEVSSTRTFDNANKTVDAAFQSLQSGANPSSVWNTVSEARETAYAIQPVTKEQRGEDDRLYSNRFNSIVATGAVGSLISSGTVNEERAFIILDRLSDGQTGDQYADRIRDKLQGGLNVETAAEVKTAIGKQVDEIQKTQLDGIKLFVRESSVEGKIIDTSSIQEMALSAPIRHRVGYYEAMQLADGYNDGIYVSQVEQALYSGVPLSSEWWTVINQVRSQASRSRLSREALTNIAESQPTKDLARAAIMASGAAMSDKRAVVAKYTIQNSSPEEFTYEEAVQALDAVQSGVQPASSQIESAVTLESAASSPPVQDVAATKKKNVSGFTTIVAPKAEAAAPVPTGTTTEVTVPVEPDPALASQIVQDQDVEPTPVVPKTETKGSQSYLNGMAAASWLRLEQKEQNIGARAPISEGMPQDAIAQNILYNKSKGILPTVAEYLLLDATGRQNLMDAIDKLDLGEPAVSDPMAKSTIIDLWKDTGYSNEALKEYGQLLYLNGKLNK